MKATEREAGVRDAVGAADRLRAAVVAGIEDALAAAPAPLADVYVGWVAAAEAADCPARYRAAGEGGWGFPGWSAPNAAAAVGRAALDHHLHRADAAGPAPATRVTCPPRSRSCAAGSARPRSPVAPGVGGWVGDLRADGDAATLAATAGLATRWTGRVRPGARLAPARRPGAAQRHPRRRRLRRTPVVAGQGLGGDGGVRRRRPHRAA